jgi:hypothetical protein
MLLRPGERHTFGRNLAFLERFLVLYAHDEMSPFFTWLQGRAPA